MMSVTLSDEFQPFADEIMASRKPSVPFTLSCAETRLWQSKVGGKPYLPLDMAYPNNPDGEPLFFLAQVNFAEMPALPDFPTKGILQFYIDGKDDCYGINHEDYSDHSRYKLVYHADVMEDVSKLQQDFDFIDFDENEDYGVPFPAHHSYQIHFQSVAQQIITREDFSFAQVLPRLSSFLDEKCEDRKYNWELHDQYAELTDNEQHRIGGYPFFKSSG